MEFTSQTSGITRADLKNNYFTRKIGFSICITFVLALLRETVFSGDCDHSSKLVYKKTSEKYLTTSIPFHLFLRHRTMAREFQWQMQKVIADLTVLVWTPRTRPGTVIHTLKDVSSTWLVLSLCSLSHASATSLIALSSIGHSAEHDIVHQARACFCELLTCSLLMQQSQSPRLNGSLSRKLHCTLSDLRPI